jgi:predicted SAM-dependent methyltransferase
MGKTVGKDIPAPSVMPVDRVAWAQEVNLSSFVNAGYAYRDLQKFSDVRKILIIGPGQGLDTQVLKWRMYEVATLDIDETFKPDVLGSVHDLSMFADGSFDAVLVSHVLEHLAVPYLDRCLQELARVGRYCLIYLPVAGRHFQVRLSMGIRGIDLSYIIDVFNYFHRPDGVTPRYCAGQHYWELGMRGFQVADLVRRFEKYFEVILRYRNRDWNPSYNFVLRTKNTR